MYWAEHTIGLEAALNRINQFADRYGRENWTPAPMLERLVAEGGSLRDIQND